MAHLGDGPFLDLTLEEQSYLEQLSAQMLSFCDVSGLQLLTLCDAAGRADPKCMLGQLLKILFMNDDFNNAVSFF